MLSKHPRAEQSADCSREGRENITDGMTVDVEVLMMVVTVVEVTGTRVVVVALVVWTTTIIA